MAISRSASRLEIITNEGAFDGSLQGVGRERRGDSQGNRPAQNQHSLFQPSSQRRPLDLAILPIFGTRWLAPRLPRFLSQKPGVAINLATRLSYFDFRTEALDAAIHFGPRDRLGVEMVLLLSEAVVPPAARS
ncbi:LysR substrate-binding domain-containing protein [Bradyrhizobium sp. CB82]|uniref:LysR substrate-binding domain-containing protein n=1 Tax=Bradyrhizobium sp. CB82 TaxID=3039159 RepID=UPI0024B1C79F|nr:LysR substrate-binding domain-containing protein [Bradyrhizobium sp. CB82]WFU39982.1 LysR substrate-binding domain-containing protein [Bradyrhizobium sp. CB82]